MELTQEEFEEEQERYYSYDLMTYVDKMDKKVFELFKEEVKKLCKAFQDLEDKLDDFFNGN